MDDPVRAIPVLQVDFDARHKRDALKRAVLAHQHERSSVEVIGIRLSEKLKPALRRFVNHTIGTLKVERAFEAALFVFRAIRYSRAEVVVNRYLRKLIHKEAPWSIGTEIEEAIAGGTAKRQGRHSEALPCETHRISQRLPTRPSVL